MSETDALQMDERARREALDVRRSLLLQAPAGSGKTTVLTARFLALLAVADAPEEILAITFTRKAAAEMRHRILAALQAADEQTAIPGIDPKLLQNASARDRACGWQLRRNATRLRIETIDALSYRLASALPIAARSGPALRITATPAPLYRQAARTALRSALEQPATAAAVRLLLDRLDNRWLRLERLLAGMLARRSHWLPRVLQAHSDGLVQRVTESLDAVLRAELAGLAAKFSAAALREAEQLLSQRAGGEPATLSAEPASLEHWRALCELTLTLDGHWRQKLTARDGLGRDDGLLKQRVRDWIEARQDEAGIRVALDLARKLPEPQLRRDEQEALSALTLLLTGAAAELQLHFAEQGKVDYAYVAAAARQALSEQGEPSDLALHASAELRHILLDEFQDTSLEQFELLQALTTGWERGDGRTMFIVGDPMQSIYQFREAEVGLFLRVRDRGLGAVAFETLQLRRNFRSRAGLIDWINAHFVQLFPQQDDPRLAAVRFLSSAAPAAEAQPAGAAVSLHRVAAGDRAAEAARVLAIVGEARQRSAQSSIVVLVAAREHAALIVAPLRAAGYALRGVDLEPLRDRAVVRDLSALARALSHGADRTGWLAILRAPWCGLTLAALEHFVQQASADLFSSLRAWLPAQIEDAARVARLCAALEPAMRGVERGLPLWQRVERCWLRLGGPAIYPEAADRLDAHRFMDALAMHEEPDTLVGDAISELTEPLFSVAPPQPGAIEVMTIHAAKGLEWDVVIVPGLDSRGAPDTDPLLHWIELPRMGEGTDLLLAPIRAADAAEALLAAYIKRLRRTRQLFERTRQLYVAATRARRSLHLLGAIDCAPPNGKPPAPMPGSLLASLWPAIAVEFCAPETSCEASGNARPVAAGVQLRRLPADWRQTLPPPLPRPQRLRLSAAAGSESPEYSWVGLTARAIGTVVHGELRRLASLPVLPHAGDLQRRAGYYGAWLAELGVAVHAQPRAEALIVEALERTLADPRGRWLLSAQHLSAESEWRLTGAHEGRIVNVVFDRMLIDDQRQRWIIDYKTSRHEGGALAQFIAQEAERYTPQLRRYAALAAALGDEPVRVALYFPLLGVFRELSM